MGNPKSPGQLPPLRLIFHPFLGFGADFRVPCGPRLNAVMSAEASVNGDSLVGFGIESRRVPWLRLHLAPAFQISLRLPIVRFSECKFMYGGGVATLGKHGRIAKFDASTADAMFRSVCGLLAPSLELQHQMTVYEAVFDERQRKAFRSSLDDFAEARSKDRARLKKNRDKILRSFDPPERPPLDPRKPSESRMSVRERRVLNERALELARRQRIDLKKGPPIEVAPAGNSKKKTGVEEKSPMGASDDSKASFVRPVFPRLLLGTSL